MAACVDRLLALALPAGTAGKPYEATGVAGVAAAGLTPKKLLQRFYDVGDDSGIQTIDNTSPVETEAQVQITPLSATSLLIVWAEGYMGTDPVDATTSLRSGWLLIEQDTTAGEGGVANGTVKEMMAGGRTLASTSATQAASLWGLHETWMGISGSLTQRTFTPCAKSVSADVPVTVRNTTASGAPSRPKIVVEEWEV